MLKQKLEEKYYCWIIAYIDVKFLKHVEAELNKFPEYEEVQAYIPTVKILKKTFKKENFFEEVPLLFNYGFFKVPRKYAIYKDWLENMQRNISCIYGWVRDAANTLKEKPVLRLDGKSVFPKVKSINKKKKTVKMKTDKLEDKNIPFATATSAEVARLIRDTVNMGAHNAEDISLLKNGDNIILRGYPFEGVSADVISIDHKKQSVLVTIRIFDQMKEVSVSFDNVFFTIYHNHNYDDSLSTLSSIDEMESNKTFDKAQHKNIKK